MLWFTICISKPLRNMYKGVYPPKSISTPLRTLRTDQDTALPSPYWKNRNYSSIIFYHVYYELNLHFINNIESINFHNFNLQNFPKRCLICEQILLFKILTRLNKPITKKSTYRQRRKRQTNFFLNLSSCRTNLRINFPFLALVRNITQFNNIDIFNDNLQT